MNILFKQLFISNLGLYLDGEMKPVALFILAKS